MSNIEDIKFIEEMIKEYKTFGDLHNPDYEDTDRIYKALENVLERIKELEEENKLLLNGKVGIDLSYDDYIPVQKVKDLIKNETINISNFECIAVEDLEKLMEDK